MIAGLRRNPPFRTPSQLRVQMLPHLRVCGGDAASSVIPSSVMTGQRRSLDPNSSAETSYRVFRRTPSVPQTNLAATGKNIPS